jgi:FkbM family methyltransferase
VVRAGEPRQEADQGRDVAARLVALSTSSTSPVLRDPRAALAARRDFRRALRVYREFVPHDGLCLDVGANIGNRTEVFLALSARVIAVEPLPANIQALRDRFGTQITLVGAVLGPTEGETELMVASYHTLSSLSAEWVEAVQASGRFAEFDWDERLTVPMLTLDQLIGRYGVPDFCKIDRRLRAGGAAGPGAAIAGALVRVHARTRRGRRHRRPIPGAHRPEQIQLCARGVN